MDFENFEKVKNLLFVDFFEYWFLYWVSIQLFRFFSSVVFLEVLECAIRPSPLVSCAFYCLGILGYVLNFLQCFVVGV